MSDLDALKKAAEAATPGPWNASRTRRYVKEGIGAPWVCELDCGNKRWEANSAFIALANPATVLDLIARLEAAEEALIKAAVKFADYAVLHAAKGTPDADAKAETNRDMSAMCSAALARIRGDQP